MEEKYSSDRAYSCDSSSEAGLCTGRLEKLSIALPLRRELKGHLVDSAPV